MMLSRPLALIGMMGAGKSSLGRRLALQMSVPFVDSDEEIVAEAGMSIADIFEHEGEAGFRARERTVLQRLLTEHPVGVLSSGGGAFMNPETRALMLERALVVWLRAPLEVLCARVARRTDRPLLQHGDPCEILGQLLKAREPVYAEAPVVVDVDQRPQDENASRLLQAALAYLEEHS